MAPRRKQGEAGRRAPAGGAQTLVLDTLEDPAELRVPEGVRVIRAG